MVGGTSGFDAIGVTRGCLVVRGHKKATIGLIKNTSGTVELVTVFPLPGRWNVLGWSVLRQVVRGMTRTYERDCATGTVR
jgi:hypothetical protein